MAGFQIGRTFLLDFGQEGETDAFGAEVRMRSASIGTLIEWTTCSPEREREIFTDHLISWNLEDNGVPLPAEPASILRLDPPLRSLMYVEWVKATRGVTAPFDRRSDDGDTPPGEAPPEPSIPMVDL